MRRREAIAGLSASLAASLPALEAFGQDRNARPTDAPAAGICVLTITGDEGPFYFDPNLVRRDITELKPGVPLAVVIRVVAAEDCRAIEGARTDLWQADAYGLYSGYDQQTGVTDRRTLSTLGETFLRGTQFTDADGAALFTTIYPSWYRGRTPHLHFKVFLGGSSVVTNQVIFPEHINDAVLSRRPYNEHAYVRDAFNATDTYLKRDGSGVLCDVELQREGYSATLLVGVRRA